MSMLTMLPAVHVLFENARLVFSTCPDAAVTIGTTVTSIAIEVTAVPIVTAASEFHMPRKQDERF